MLVTNKQDSSLKEYLDFVIACVESGVTSVQLREKKLSFDVLIEFGRMLQSVLKPRSIPLIVNDSIEITRELNADGVHLGQSDGNVSRARQELGDNKIIGLTIDAMEQINSANELPIDYIGVSAVFPTKNKPDVATIWGCDGLEKVAKLSRTPTVAIGGINETNIGEVIKTGVHGIAAIGAFHDAKDPRDATKNLCKHIYGIKYDRTNIGSIEGAQQD